MDKLEYCLSLLQQGLDRSDIRQKLKENNFSDEEIALYINEADKLYLKELTYNQKYKISKSFKKTLVLFISLALLAAVFMGYAKIGLITLFIFWGYLGSFRILGARDSKGKNYFKR